MKKLLTVLLLILCIITAVGCGGVTNTGPSGGKPSGSKPPKPSSDDEIIIQPESPSTPEIGDVISICDLYSWISQTMVNDVEYITSKVDVGSVSPDLFYAYNRFKIATEREEIQDILTKILSIKVKRAQDPYWAGGSSEKVTVKLKNGNSYTLSSYYSGFYYNDEYYVYVDCALPVCSTDYGRQFLSHAVWNMKLYYNDVLVENTTNATCANFLYGVIYTVNDGLDYVQDQNFAGYSFKDAYLGEIKVISNSQFAIITEEGLNAVCTIVNGLKFSEIIAIL